MQNKTGVFDWKQTFFSNWNFIRIARLFFAIVILYEAFRTKETFYAIAGGLFLVQSVFNWGCCGMRACSASPEKNNSSAISDEIIYEEVKGEK